MDNYLFWKLLSLLIIITPTTICAYAFAKAVVLELSERRICRKAKKILRQRTRVQAVDKGGND